jgi:hypothetical protein
MQPSSLPISFLESILAGLFKVNPADKMVSAGRVGVFNRVPTLCNQFLPHTLADIVQTLHICYGHIKDMHVPFGSVRTFFEKHSM